MRRPRIGQAWALTVLSLLVASPAAAQTSLQVPLQFDFLNPGARSLALGSAFAGLADDATAAFTNPAGLTVLRRAEISAEGRFRNITTPFLNRGRLSGTLTNRGDDTVTGASYSESTDNRFGAGFLSFVYPKGRWAIAAYRHELVKIDDSFEARGVFQDVATPGGTLQLRELPLNADRQIDIENYGVSAGFRVNDRLSIGGGLSVYHFSLESTFIRFDTQGDLFGPPDYSRELTRFTQNGDDVDVGFIGGLQLQVHPKVRVGAVYRQAPKFEFQIVEPLSGVDRTGDFHAPANFSTGVLVRPSDALAIAFDYSYVQYSNLKEDYINFQAPNRTAQFLIDDVHELHGGVEYVFSSLRAQPAVRVGGWWDPQHAVRYEPTPANDQFDTRFLATLPVRDDLFHFTAGLGLAFNPRFEVNVAGDFASRRNTFSTSAIYRF
jgi:long-chain fatty acid transport protein